MQKAISRLSENDSYDRAYRIRLAMQCSATHVLLPKDQWVKPENDTRYITPIADEIQAEQIEREVRMNIVAGWASVIGN